MATTSDGGATWGHTTSVTGTNVYRGAVWYDGWTEGDSGTMVHIVAPRETDDRLYYNSFDMTTGVAGTPTTTSLQTPTTLGAANYTSITKSRAGILYTTIRDDSDSWVEQCSSACDDTDNWTEITNPYPDNGDTPQATDLPVLVPVPGTDNVMLILWSSSARDVESDIWSATSSSWWGWDLNIDQAAQQDYGQYGGMLSATVNYHNGNIYLATPDDINDDTTADHDIKFWEWDGDTYTWTQKTNIITDASGITNFKISLDENNGDLYAMYVRRTDMADNTTADVYYKYSHDSGTTWSAEQGPLNILEDNLYGIMTDAMSDSRIGVIWVDTTNFEMHHATVALLGENYQSKIVPGNIGQAMKFDGVDDYVDLGDPAALQLTGSATWAAWIKADSLGVNGEYHFITKNGLSSDRGWTLGRDDSTGNFQVGIADSGNNNIYRKGNLTPVVGTWYHVVGVYDSSAQTLDLYVNGVLDDGTLSASVPSSQRNSGNNAYMGRKENAAEFWDGIIDDVRVYNRALSADEVARLYDLGATTHINKTIRTNPELENGLVGHWTFDGTDMDIASNTAEILDSSGNGYNADWQNHATTTVAGVLGQAIYFDGSDDYATVQDTDDAFDPGTGDMTAAIWAKVPDENQLSVMLSKQYPIDSGGGWGMLICNTDNCTGSGQRFAIAFNESTAHSRQWSVARDVADNRWHHFAFTVDGSAQEIVMYIDGEIQTPSENNNGSWPTVANDREVRIARGHTNGYFKGPLDDARYYNRVLSPEEIKRLYDLGATTHVNKTITTNPDLNNGLMAHWTFDGPDTDWASTTAEITDTTGNGNDGRANSMSVGVNSKPGKIGQAIWLPGDNTDYVTVDNPTSAVELGTSDATISLWANSEVKTGFGSFIGYVEKGGGGPTDEGYALQYSTTTGIIYFRLSNGVSRVNRASDSSLGMEDGKWHHILATIDRSSDVTFYIDGVERGFGDISAYSGDNISDPSEALNIGGFGHDAIVDTIQGKIDDVRFYNRVLSREEITRLYQLGQ